MGSPTDKEIEILKVLWDLGEGSVRAVVERLAPMAVFISIPSKRSCASWIAKA